MTSTTQIINISSDQNYGKCNKKCDLSFRYSISSCVATNTGGYIAINYDNATSLPVTFNNTKYNVTREGLYPIALFSPSLHLFNGSYTDAEIVVTHVSENQGQILRICIPVSSTGVVGPATSMLKEIINSVSKNAPNAWQKTNVNLPNFSLQHIVPTKPFYSFTDSMSSNIIVYGVENAIGLDSSTLKMLKSIVQSSTGNVNMAFFIGNPPIYKNYEGPNNAKDDQIYIDCQPVNESEEQLEIKEAERKPETTYDSGDLLKMILNSVLFQCVVVVIVLIILLYGIKNLATSVYMN